MTLDEYLLCVDNGADQCINGQLSIQDYVERQCVNNPNAVSDIINIRASLITQQDINSVTGYLDIGYFKDFNANERMALFSYVFDISRIFEVKSLRNRFEQYKKDHPIFSKDASMHELIREKSIQSKDMELIDSKGVNCVYGSDIFERKGYYYKLDLSLKPVIFTLTKSAFPTAPVYIRLDPQQVYDSQPAANFCESVLIPANPNWWRQLRIHHRSKEGCSYILDSPSTPHEDLDRYWDFHVRGVRRLDVVAKRNSSNNLSMMIEELSYPMNKKNLLIGRCIHLDTDSPYGSSFSEAVVNHLDLAINVYENDDVTKRLDSNLANGNKVTDATFRSHLFRIEGIPLVCLIPYCLMFFQSRSLTGEWISDQFGQVHYS
jgi:hypothetical protein